MPHTMAWMLNTTRTMAAVQAAFATNRMTGLAFRQVDTAARWPEPTA
ncbi:hypothetical protein GA0070607_5910 [Micromonospora coriariae]|uniref:Uncharacterized protein n=1 Tax=Micromonospora coriariae TaxID=285665 RepID=A0A1C4XXF5_9ACTN|nr:hypothetical protein GA0070607_5910 [Micromonospora coriariae]